MTCDYVYIKSMNIVLNKVQGVCNGCAVLIRVSLS